jgi:NADH dehydrogenase
MNRNHAHNHQLPHVVILGAGFGGLRTARQLAHTPVRVTLIDRNNYHLFQPLLYQVASAGLSPNEIAYPVRSILRRQPNADFLLAEVHSVDLAARRLETSAGPLDYDYLLLAAGGQTNYFGLPSVEENSLGLKDLADAAALRDHLLRLFEAASRERDLQERRSMLTFVIAGGGPTGVELTGALSELITLVLSKDFPRQNIAEVRILLLEAAQRLLPGMPEDLARHTVEILRRKGVEVRFDAAVSGFDRRQVTLRSGEVIPARTLIWAAGIRPSGLVRSLGAELAPGGRVRVEPTLQLPGRPEVFVIGDAAYFEDEAGQPLPMVAPVATQQADCAVDNLRRMLESRPLKPFRYKDPGAMATIGRNQAVARLGRFQFRGFIAWIIWIVVHIYQLIGFRNRLVTLINWAWDYFLYDRAIRTIGT